MSSALAILRSIGGDYSWPASGNLRTWSAAAVGHPQVVVEEEDQVGVLMADQENLFEGAPGAWEELAGS